MFSPVSMRPWRSLAAILTLSAAAAAQAAGPEILNQVPSDAYGVVIVGNARGLANKVSNAATRLHMSLPPDLLGSMTRSVGITSGFDPNGSAALILLKPAAGSDHAGSKYFDGMPPAVLLVPTTNASLMLEKFNPTTPDKDGISQVALPDNPEEKGFSAVVDKKWIALAQKKEDLQAYLARGSSFASTANPDTLKVFEGNDLVLWGNVEKLGEGVDKWLDDQQANLIGMRDLTNFVQGGDAFSATMEKHGMRLVFDLSREFFKDAGASMVTVRLTDSGATLGLIADFKTDSALGKFVAAQGSPDGVSLQGLPSGNYLMAGAAKWNGQSMAAVIGNFMNQIVSDPALAGDKRADDLKKSISVITEMGALSNGMSFSLLVPPARGKDGYLTGAFLVETSDPKKLMDLELQAAGTVMAAENMNADIKTTVTVSANALTVKDVPLAKMNMKMSLREETADKPIPQASKAAFEAAQKLYGEGGMTMYLGVVGKRMLVIYGSDLPLMESAITAAQGNTDELDAVPEITAIKDQIVSKPVAVMYMPLARWVTLAQTIETGRDVPAGPAASAPPMVVSLGISGHMVTAEIHVPIATVIATQDAVTRMQEGPMGPPGRVLPNLP